MEKLSNEHEAVVKNIYLVVVQLHISYGTCFSFFFSFNLYPGAPLDL